MAPNSAFDIEVYEEGERVVLNIDLDESEGDGAAEFVEILSGSGDRSKAVELRFWLKFVGEFLVRGMPDDAEVIAQAGLQNFAGRTETQQVAALLAFIQMKKAKKAPKMSIKPETAAMLSKDAHYTSAQQILTYAEKSAQIALDGAYYLTQSLLLLQQGQIDDAMKRFSAILDKFPTHLIALHAKARILLARKSYQNALQIYQTILKLSPFCSPDPRIGIGLCLQKLNMPDRAMAAWVRALELDPKSAALHTLIGIYELNAIRSSSMDESRQVDLLQSSATHFKQALAIDNLSPMPCALLSSALIEGKQYAKAQQMAEIAIQYADSKPVLVEGYTALARIAHNKFGIKEAVKFYQIIAERDKGNLVSGVGEGCNFLESGELIAAKHHFDQLHTKNPMSATLACISASLNALSLPGFSAKEQEVNRAQAKSNLEKVVDSLDSDSLSELSRLHIESQDYQQVKSVLEVTHKRAELLGLGMSAIMINNRAVLTDDFVVSKSLLEQARLKLDANSTEILTVTYNQARLLERLGDIDAAAAAYRNILNTHPEYVDAKGRLAALLLETRSAQDSTEAHSLLKASLASQSTNGDLRAHYAHFLIQSHVARPTKTSFTQTTAYLKGCLADFKNDIFFLCAYARVTYDQARADKPQDKAGQKERQRNLTRAVDCFDKALQLDPKCAVAAQGLAIAIVEDVLATKPSDAVTRGKNIMDAMSILSRVRETGATGAVYTNIGHCHYMRGELPKAIEAYETAAIRFFKSQNAQVLVYLARAYYAKAALELNYPGLLIAVKHLKSALALAPRDLTIAFNLALVQQRAAQILMDLPPTSRTMDQLVSAFEGAEQARQSFKVLAQPLPQNVGYDRDLAEQRGKYADILQRKESAAITLQRSAEAEMMRGQEAQRLARSQEIQRELDEEHMRKEAERLKDLARTEARATAREEAIQWGIVHNELDIEEEVRRVRQETKRQARENNRGDGHPKKSRVTKSSRHRSEDGRSDDEAAASDTGSASEGSARESQEGNRPKTTRARRAKKRVGSDDEEKAHPPSKRSKKDFLSKEFVDSDDDLDDPEEEEENAEGTLPHENGVEDKLDGEAASHSDINEAS